MKKAILAALVLSVFAVVAHAQNIPLADVSGGYSMLRSSKGAA